MPPGGFTAVTSLLSEEGSLMCLKQFPVPPGREFSHKYL